MLTIKHSDKSGWEKPVIEPLKELSIHPGAKVLHYATEVNNIFVIFIAKVCFFKDF
jgi:hypothetical protein